MHTSALSQDDPSRLNKNVEAAAAVADLTPVDDMTVRRATASARDAVTRTSLTSVQALRGVAMTLVVTHHVLLYIMSQLSGWPIDGSVLRQFPVLKELAFGVDIFFTISGFLLMLIAKPYLDRRRTITNFCLHRLLRIWPLYLLVTCFILGREFFRYSVDGGILPDDFSPSRLAGLAFFLSFNVRHELSVIYQPGWTLAYEVWFYACFAIALKFSENRRELMSCVVAVLLASMVIGYNLTEGSVSYVFFTDPLLIEFLIGAAICLVLQAGKQIPLPAGWWLFAGLLWLFVFVDINVGGWRLGTRGIPAAFVLIALLKLEGVAAFPAWLVSLGHASYSIFLTHDLLLGRIGNTAIGMLDGLVPRAMLGETAAILTLVPTVFIGWVVFRIVEKPLNKAIKARIGA